MFATNDYLFAISGGDKYVIIDVQDIYHPKYVSEYEHPERPAPRPLGAGRHRVLGSGRGTGTVVGGRGQRQVRRHDREAEAHQRLPDQQRAHEIYPVRAGVHRQDLPLHRRRGDEPRPAGCGKAPTTCSDIEPRRAACRRRRAGYTHIVDFTDPMNPKKVGRTTSRTSARTTSSSRTTSCTRRTTTAACGWWTCRASCGQPGRPGREIAVFKPYDPKGLHRQRVVRDERDAVEGARPVHRLQQRALGGEAGAETSYSVGGAAGQRGSGAAGSG